MTYVVSVSRRDFLIVNFFLARTSPVSQSPSRYCCPVIVFSVLALVPPLANRSCFFPHAPPTTRVTDTPVRHKYSCTCARVKKGPDQVSSARQPERLLPPPHPILFTFKSKKNLRINHQTELCSPPCLSRDSAKSEKCFFQPYKTLLLQ